MQMVTTLRRRLRAFAIFALLAVALAALAVTAYGHADRVASADAAVIPGNTVHPDGTPSNRLKARLDAGLAIFREGRCRFIVVSGAIGREGVDESAVMKDYLVARGVPVDRVIQDPGGVDTAATARNAADALRPRGLHTVIAVSQFFHVPRLRLLLASRGLEVVGHEHARYHEWRDVYATLREVVALGACLARLPGHGLVTGT